MNVNLYCKINPVKSFFPNEEITIRVEFSNRLAPNKMKLIIDNYSLTVNNKTFNGITLDGFASSAIGGVWCEDFVILPNTLGEMSPAATWSGAIECHAEIVDEEENVIIKSNTLLLDMIVCEEFQFAIYDSNGLEFPNNIINYNTPTMSVTLQSLLGFNIGDQSRGELNSYSITIYDESMNIFWDSGSLYNWYTYQMDAISYKLPRLKNKSKYFIKINGIIISGSSVKSDIYTIITNYLETAISPSTELIAENFPTKAAVNISLDKIYIPTNVTTAILSQSVHGFQEWMVLKKLTVNSFQNINILDFFGLQDVEYDYQLSLLSGNSLVKNYSTTIVSHFDGVCIADITAAYATSINVKVLPIQQIFESQIQTTLNNKYAYTTSNSDTNYRQISVSGLFLETDDNCNYIENSVGLYQSKMLDFLANKKVKLLKTNFGGWLVNILPSPQIIPSEDSILSSVSFECYEASDVNDIENFSSLGLI